MVIWGVPQQRLAARYTAAFYLPIRHCRTMSASPPLSDDPAFLKDQVLRLSAELARNQGRQISADVELEPWMLNAEQLPPLLHAYDARIADLEKSEAAQRDAARSAESDLRNMQQETDRMRTELHHALEASVRTEAFAAHTASHAKASDPAARELQERLDILYQENEVLVEQQRETGEELERLREEKLAQARDHMGLVKQIAALRDELAAADVRARRAAESRDRARDELQQCASELIQAQEHTQSAMGIAERHASERDAALSSVAEHRTMLETLNGRASTDREALQADLAVARAAERDMRDKAGMLERQLQQSSEREDALMQRLSAELSDKAAGAEALSVLESRCNDAESRQEGLGGELASTSQRLQEAEREKAHLAAQVTALEASVQRAEERLKAITDEERGRREALAASLRKEALSRNSALEEEVRTMEQTIADLNHQLQRAQRDARGKGSRVDNAAAALGAAGGGPLTLLGGVGLRPYGSVDVGAGGGGAGGYGDSGRTLDEMAGRLANAERERDSMESQKRSLAMQLRSVTDSTNAERSSGTARSEAAQRAQRRLEDEMTTLRQERAKLLGQVAELEQSLQAARSELASVRHAGAEELRIASEASQAQIATLQRSLADARALHEQSAAEVEELLKSQEELSARYRSEAKTIAERSEALVVELRAESERLTIRNAELSAQLSQVTSTSSTLERADREKSSQVTLLQKQLNEVQQVRAQQAGLLSQLRAAETSWASERKVLTRQLRSEQSVSLSGGAGVGFPFAAATLAPSDRSVRSAAAQEVEDALANARLAQQPGLGASGKKKAVAVAAQ